MVLLGYDGTSIPIVEVLYMRQISFGVTQELLETTTMTMVLGGSKFPYRRSMGVLMRQRVS